MGFYYISIFSIFLLGIVYAVLLLIFWGIARLTRGMPGRKAVLAVVGAVFLVLPVAEELWIAWNFGQLCRKDAGIFIHRTVEVEGFYDATMRSAYENTKPGRYRFVEHATEDRKGVERVERADESMKNEALAWYARTNPGKDRPKDRSIYYRVNDRETIAVLPNGIDAWRVTVLDRPTARYHFLTDSGVQIVHGVRSQTSTIVDAESGTLLARYTRYNRMAPWFYVGLDRPRIACDGPDGGPNIKHSFLIYREALKPASAEEGVRK